MTVFLIQTENMEIIHDFAFALTDAVRYHKWYYGNDSFYDYILTDTCESPEQYEMEDIVPIGSIEFVQEFLKRYYQIEGVKPLNIPEELRRPEYLKRWVEYRTYRETFKNDYASPVFVKDNDKLKGYTSIVRPGEEIEAGNYIVSEVVDIDSEWRAFVHDGELVGLQNYLGDFTMFPDVSLIKKMVESFKGSPTAYTLDVGIRKD